MRLINSQDENYLLQRIGSGEIMSLTFSNLKFEKIILHNVYKPNDEGRVDPVTSTVLTELGELGSQKLEERITKVLGNGSHSLQMEIALDGDASCFRSVVTLLEDSKENFITNSATIAELHTQAHTSKSWPGGTLVVISGTVGVSNKRCLIIIKAEQQAGFSEKVNQGQVLIEYLDNLILTPQSRLYKVGAFIEISRSKLPVAERVKDDFEAYVFDNNIKANDDRKAARYFYSNFLGLRIPQNGKQRTRDFYELTSEFINSAELDAEARLGIQQALHTYLKVDQSVTIQVSEFATRYMPEDARDDYSHFMAAKQFPTTAIEKDLSIIKRKLVFRKMNFSSKIKLTGPAELFDESVSIVEETDEHTTLKIKGILTDQV